ncbi:MAG: AIR synthase related protein [Candidatus Bathyarchaeia archaeon]|jgi:hypothetical protein
MTIAKSIETARDVILLRTPQNRILVVGCDSTGAVGQKPLDALKVHPSIVGKFTARVALMEVIAVGARPISLSVALCVEPKPTGREIMNGVRNELRTSRIKDITVVQSSEKNFPVKQTSVGTMVNGIVENRRLKIGKCKHNDWLIAVGDPRVGREVIEGERAGSITDLNDAFDLLELPYVHEIIPVGSRGISREARTITTDSRLHFYPARNATVNLKKSAGPATVILCAIDPAKWSELNETVDKPLRFIGKVR